MHAFKSYKMSKLHVGLAARTTPFIPPLLHKLVSVHVQVNMCCSPCACVCLSPCPAGKKKVTDRWIKARSRGHGIHHAPFTVIPRPSSSSSSSSSFLFFRYIKWSLAHLLTSPLLTSIPLRTSSSSCPVRDKAPRGNSLASEPPLFFLLEN